MKKIINGKKYDTETAKKVGFTCSSLSRKDFSFWEEELYKKKSGEFFLHGSGGPASQYSKRVDMTRWSGDERIIPLTEEKAKKWAEENLNADEYEEIFGEVEE